MQKTNLALSVFDVSETLFIDRKHLVPNVTLMYRRGKQAADVYLTDSCSEESCPRAAACLMARAHGNKL